MLNVRNATQIRISISATPMILLRVNTVIALTKQAGLCGAAAKKPMP
jgi:hypothetical protein